MSFGQSAWKVRGTGLSIRVSPPSETETIVHAEIKYFTQLNRDFEWKVYSQNLRATFNIKYRAGCQTVASLR